MIVRLFVPLPRSWNLIQI